MRFWIPRSLGKALLIAVCVILVVYALRVHAPRSRGRVVSVRTVAYGPASEYFEYLDCLFAQAMRKVSEGKHGKAMTSMDLHIQPCDGLDCAFPAQTVAVNCEHTLQLV